MKKLICPYCLRTLTPANLIKVCSANLSHTLPGGLISFGSNRCREPKCNGVYIRRKCGKCGESLPPTIDQYDCYMRLAVVSPPGGGKTVYLTTMFHDLQVHSRVLGFNLSAMDAETAQYYEENMKKLYRDKSLTGMATNSGAYTPMQWSIQDVKKGMGKNIVPTYSLTIFDGAGEDQKSGEEQIRRYIAESKMILILLDPIKLYGVRKRMTDEEIIKAGGDLKEPITPEFTRIFINSIIEYVKTYSGLNIKQKLKIPVAVAFAKIDMMRRFFPEGSMVFQPSGHVAAGKFIEIESQQIHSEIDAWMEQCGDDLSSLFSGSFVNWRYFGLSSFGEQPESLVRLSCEPVPLRVLDPLMWNLHLEKLI